VHVKIKCLEVLAASIKFETGTGYTRAMEANVVGTLKVALAAVSTPELEAAICKVFAYVAYNMDGKDAIVKCGAAALIMKLLASPHTPVKLAASSAISYFTIALSGKVVVLDFDGGVRMLIKNIIDEGKDTNEVVIVNCMQALANVAEHPKAKAMDALQGDEILYILDELSKRPNALVQRAAKLCIQKITWRP